MIHPTMFRQSGELQNASFETIAMLDAAGIPVGLQSSHEAYVPKTRVVLFEASAALAFGLAPERALAAVTIVPAEILGVADRVGSIQVGKDGDLALFSGEPLETLSRVQAVIINGVVVSDRPR